MKPTVKWVSGKQKVVKFLEQNLSKRFNSYHEPFVGGVHF